MGLVYELVHTLRTILETHWASSKEERKQFGSSQSSCCSQTPTLQPTDEQALLLNNNINHGQCPAAQRNQPYKTWYHAILYQIRETNQNNPFHFGREMARTLMHIVETTLAYALMLIAMTFNTGMFVAVIGGIGLGSLLMARYRGYTRRLCC